MMCKHPATHDEVIRGMKLEQKQLSGLYGAKLVLAFRAPEIHFIGRRIEARQIVEPSIVGYADVDSHGLVQ